MIDLSTCKFIVYGYRNLYDTMSHIQEGFYRALKYMGKDVIWVDETVRLGIDDLYETFVICHHENFEGCTDRWPDKRKYPLPLTDSENAFYAVHGLYDNPVCNALFKGHKNHLGWNVLNMREMRNKLGLNVMSVLEDEYFIDEDVPFSLPRKYLEMRWATDLTPDEIEKNKPGELLSLKNKVINFVGTRWWVNEKELSDFISACKKDGCKFNHLGAGQYGVVSIEDNVRLQRESYFSPQISGSHHLTERYVPDRAFKNISYGQMGVTNNPAVNDLFKGKLIFNPNTYDLYFEAKERLKTTTVEQVHELMDEVKEKHTYVNRINSLLKAAKEII